MGVVLVSFVVGSVRERCIWRSDEPVNTYVPPMAEKVRAFMGPAWEEMVLRSVVGSLEIIVLVKEWIG